jgi:hypothetical protein
VAAAISGGSGGIDGLSGVSGGAKAKIEVVMKEAECSSGVHANACQSQG